MFLTHGEGPVAAGSYSLSPEPGLRGSSKKANVIPVPRLEGAVRYEERVSVILEILKAPLPSHTCLGGATVLLT